MFANLENERNLAKSERNRSAIHTFIRRIPRRVSDLQPLLIHVKIFGEGID